MSEPDPSRRRHAGSLSPRASALLLLLVVAAAFVAFLPALEAGFVNWDDDVNFTNNAAFRGLGWANLRWMFTTTLMGHWIPLTWLTLGLNYALGGMNPFGYHLVNVLVHAMAAGVFFLVARRMLAAAFAAPHDVDPGCMICRNNLGTAALAAGRPGEAEAAFRTAIALRPDRVPPWNNLGTALAVQERYDEAGPAFARAVELSQGQFRDAVANLGRIHVVKGRWPRPSHSCGGPTPCNPASPW